MKAFIVGVLAGSAIGLAAVSGVKNCKCVLDKLFRRL